MIGEGITKAMTFAFIVCAIMSAVVGWGVIEGVIWLFKHIEITLV
jgi:hypothetical protein